MEFIITGGNCCIIDNNGNIINNDMNKDRISVANNNNLLLNEILRGLAQLLYHNADKLQMYKEIILQTLLEHCDYRSVDIDSRHAAVDAIASVMLLPSNTEDNIKNISNDDENSNELIIQKQSSENLLIILHDKCEHAIIDNLQSCINMVFGGISIISQTSSTMKFLVSCLRAVAQIVGNYVKQKEMDKTKKHALEKLMKPQHAAQQRFQSLVQAAYMIFDKILLNKTNNINGTNSASEIKLISHTFNFLGALASFNPNGFVGSWQLFLSDLPSIDTALEHKILKYFASFDSYIGENCDILGNESKDNVVKILFRSPIFSTAYQANLAFVRASAVKCLKSLLKGLPLHKWFRNHMNTKKEKSLQFSLGSKIVSTVTKIFHFVIMMLKEEEELIVIEELLVAAKILTSELPLTVINKNTYIINAESISKNSTSNIEHLTMILFQTLLHRSIQIKSDNVEIDKFNISDCILKWLTDCLKNSPSLVSLDKALAWPYYIKYRLFRKNKLPTSNDNWRQSKPKEVICSKDIIEEGQYPHIIAKLILDLSASSISAFNNLGIVCRELIEVIFLKYNSRVMSDSAVNEKGISWLRTFVDSLSSNATPSLRLLAFKIVSIFLLISKTSSSITFRMIGCYNIMDVTQSLILATSDADHQIRGQAFSAFGLYNSPHWQELETNKAQHSKILIFRRLLEGCMDQIGTVRASSYKAIGDAILNGAINAEISKLPESNEISILEIIRKLHCGCRDSKLAVRIQAVWSLGSVLLLLLSLRQDDQYNTIECISDEVWISHGDICLHFLQDSDKIMPSSVRCIGFVAAGLIPWNSYHFSLLITYIEALMNKIFITSKESDVEMCIQKAVCKLPAKLLFSVCQALSFIGWVLVNKHEKQKRLSEKPLDYACPNDGQLYIAMNRLSLVLSIMLRYGTTKIQLHACKALVGFGGDYTTINRIDTNNIKLLYPRSFIVCFESTFNVMSELYKQSLEAPISKNNSQFQRLLALNRCLLFLIWSNLVTISTINDESSYYNDDVNMAKSIIAYYIDELLEWLTLMKKISSTTSDSVIITIEQFSLTPVISTSSDLIGLPVSVEKLVLDIAQRVWVIVQSITSNDDKNSVFNNTLTDYSMSKLSSLIKESNALLSPTKVENGNDKNNSNSNDDDEI